MAEEPDSTSQGGSGSLSTALPGSSSPAPAAETGCGREELRPRSSAKALPPFSELENTATAKIRWKKWLGQLEHYFVVTGETNGVVKRSQMLLMGGDELTELLEDLPNTGQDDAQAVAALNRHFNPQFNADYEHFQFRQAMQSEEETLDMFYSCLRRLVRTCEGVNKPFEIRSQLICGCRSLELRKLIMLQPGMDLDTILKLGRSHELADVRANAMADVLARKDTVLVPSTSVPVKDDRAEAVKATHVTKGTRDRAVAVRGRGLGCPICGRESHMKEGCPARGKQCMRCEKFGHFAIVCRGGAGPGLKGSRPSKWDTPRRGANEICVDELCDLEGLALESDDEESEDAFCVSLLGELQSTKRSQPICQIWIDGIRVPILIDSGASVNVLDADQFQRLSPRPSLRATKAQIYNYGGTTPLELLGVINVMVTYKKKRLNAKFHVTKNRKGSLLGCSMAVDLGLVTFARHVHQLHAAEAMAEFPQLFEGLGRLKGVKVKLHIDKSVQPVAVRHRRVPYHLGPLVEAELEKMEEQGVIKKVSGPTPWVSPLVLAPKQPGAIRICVDMRLPNKAIKRERHITPTIDELVADINGATWFSKVDLNSGYHLLELEENSRYITTFSTHVGLRRFKRLSFGVLSAAEVFQEAIWNTLMGLNGVVNVSDDILIFSKSLDEHHRHLRAVLRRLAESGLTLHRAKCQFYLQEVEFFGYKFSNKGMQVDPAKARAIQSATVLQSAQEVRSFLGMASYCGRFIPHLATLSEPLRNLTKKCGLEMVSRGGESFRRH